MLKFIYSEKATKYDEISNQMTITYWSLEEFSDYDKV